VNIAEFSLLLNGDESVVSRGYVSAMTDCVNVQSFISVCDCPVVVQRFYIACIYFIAYILISNVV